MVSGQRQIVYAGPIAKTAANQYIPTPAEATISIIQIAIKAQLISFAPNGAGKSVELARRFGLPNIDVTTTNAQSAPKSNRREISGDSI
jgi:hypothetical protein